MQQLIDGYRRFQRDIFPGKRELFEKLARYQHPHTLFITCSDSRIDPFLLTQAEPGEIFVVRNAGNTVPAYGNGNGGGEWPALEYAVHLLKIRTIVVCGHSHCGAMAALIDPSLTDDLPAVRSWLDAAKHIRDEIESQGLHASERSVGEAVVKRNVVLQLANLATYPIVREAVANDNLNLLGWFYRFETGEVESISPGDQEFKPL